VSRATVGKLAAYEDAGGEGFTPEGEAVVYLGAAGGERAAAIARQATSVLAVEKSPVAGLRLVERAKAQADLVPVVGDARQPEAYGPLVPELGLLVQDVAQPDQVEIFLDNADRFQPDRGYLAVKARSIAVDRPPEQVFDRARERVAEEADVREIVSLDPHHEDHVMIVADFDGASP